MRRLLLTLSGVVGGVTVMFVTVETAAQGPKADFGAFIENQIAAHAEQLFGFTHPLEESALGPFDGDSTQALVLAQGLTATLVSSAVHHSTDQIAMWPDDEHPTHLFVCDEESSNPAVQRVDLSAPPASNSTTIVTGLSACDPVRRTPWGTIVVGEEAGNLGGLYEIIDPVSITTAVNVTNRNAGTTTDMNHVAKRKTVGSLSWESLAIRENGVMIFGDELAPSGGANGGGIYKFVPTVPFLGGGPIHSPAASPFAAGTLYGLRVAASGSTNWGQGAETGKGAWVAVDTVPVGVVDINSNVILRTAQANQRFTGFYRPEDMDIDPIAKEAGVFRACWANTGRMSHGGGSLVENSAVMSEIMCLVEEPPSAAVPAPATGTIPVVERFIPGDRQFNHFDNVAFQPFTGNLVVLEDSASLDVVTPSGIEKRGDDMIICLPDGADHDLQSDGCVRFASLRDTTSEPTGFIFLASGEEAFVSLQHRSVDENHGRGSLLRISGFRIK